MQEAFKIWIDRLGNGCVQKIEESFDPSFLEIHEKELQFRSPVEVTGEAYLAEQHLVIHLNARTKASVPCAICNEMFDIELKTGPFYHSEELAVIPEAVFDFSLPLKEALLIELPRYFECCHGKCPERDALAPYLRPPQNREKETKIHFPFADLENL
ncbi:MAG TPA: hypothetical protein VLE95_08200 [Chlamydiales bacterium]|nr:hypothetical protein [Chlamydiales bacterium]